MELNIEQIVAEMRQKVASRSIGSEGDFSETEYLELYPDVRDAIAAGHYRSGYDHWLRTGRNEGRRARKTPGHANSAAIRRPSSRAFEEVRLRTLSAHLFDGIGEPTPRVNTLRGRLSYAFMRLVGRALWWYSHGLRQALESMVATLNSIQMAEVQILEALDAGVVELSAHRDETLKLASRLEAMQQGLREVAGNDEQLRKALDSTQKRLNEVAKVAHDNGTIHIPNLAHRIEASGLYAHQTRAELSLQERRLSFLLEETRRLKTESSDRLPEAPATDHSGLYVNFEAAFRGTREEIRQKQEIYIPILRDAGAGQPDRPVLDLGCGRGEWLELLRTEQMEASGFDSNPCMIDTCRSLGLHVNLANATSCLKSFRDGSAGAITAFHLAEHLPFEDLIALIDDSIRVLKPGGILILETPNPGNIQVGAQYFYLDPTHVRPLPSPMLRFFVEARGMCRVEVLELHPYPDTMRVQDGSELAKRFNEYFYGPRDYAIVARRP